GGADDDNGGVVTRRGVFGAVVLGVSSSALCLQAALDAVAGGLPPEEKPKLCDAACEAELENLPMVTTESGLQYKDIKVGQGPSPPIGFQVLTITSSFSRSTIACERVSFLITH
uniref:Uncharacterized protein n=1 Tax=Aegilops tauschii subsp. strangulata TaxID=200361 RepID=A0A453RPV6_AEGTS